MSTLDRVVGRDIFEMHHSDLIFQICFMSYGDQRFYFILFYLFFFFGGGGRGARAQLRPLDLLSQTNQVFGWLVRNMNSDIKSGFKKQIQFFFCLKFL